MSKEIIKAIGIMSGTSLDGLDIAAVDFMLEHGKWNFKLVKAATVSYSSELANALKTAPSLSGIKLVELHTNFGRFIGEQVNIFLRNANFAPDLIASHGHTVFHRPDKGYTLQIGNGATISAQTNTLTVCDFRIGDVALGGQGAPLVPIGDKLLFSEYDYCLNLGGFSNISYNKNGKRSAYDICPVNFVLNYFAEKCGFAFDKNGELGQKGNIHPQLLEQLNHLPYYRQEAPKSLGREWVENEFFPVLNTFTISDADKLRTVYEHIGIQLGNAVSEKRKMLVTGGGAFNSFLIERIKANTTAEIVIPPKDIINFKEAIIFAFLGVLRVKNINNCLASVTGAQNDSCGGIVYH